MFDTADTKSMSLATESLCKEADGFAMNCAAMQTAFALRLPSSRVRSLDSAMIRMGLESVTSLTSIGTEGLVSWVKEKVARISRKVTVVVNKIYAKITGADEKVKELIDRAAHDNSIVLPISGKKVAAVAAACTAVLAAVTYFVARGSGKGGDEAKDEGMMARVKESCVAVFKQTEADKKARAEQGFRKRKASILRDSRRLRDDKHRQAGTMPEAEKGPVFGLVGNKAKEYWVTLRRFFKALGKMITDFGSRIRGEASRLDGGNVINAETAKKAGLWERLKVFGKTISAVFTIVVSWFRAVKPKQEAVSAA